jgi:hypothetical protein
VTVDKWERRQLCADGACTGVIGLEGTCKTCGKPAPDWGDLRKPGRVSSKSESDEEVEDEASTAEPAASPAKMAASATKVSAWNERRLCVDGACVGLIGDDGVCKVCRKPADGGEPVPAEHEDEDEDEEEEEDEDDELAAGDDGEDEEDGEEGEDDEDEDDDDEVAQDDDEDDEDDDEDDEEAGDEKRTLCTDGACVGVIGDDGKCKVCGKAAA